MTPVGMKPSIKGDLFCFLPGQPHLSYCEKGQFMDMGVVYFDEQYYKSDPHAREWYRELRKQWEKNLSGRISLTKETLRDTELGVKKIMDEFGNYRSGSRSLAQSYLTLLLLGIFRQGERVVKEEFSPSARDRINNLLLYLEVNYQQKMSVDFAREFCHLSRSRFHSLFRDTTEKVFVDYLNTLRIDKAGDQLLSQGESPILDIAESCGFNEISHFCHQFKRIKGCSPRQWRNYRSVRS